MLNLTNLRESFTKINDHIHLMNQYVLTSGGDLILDEMKQKIMEPGVIYSVGWFNAVSELFTNLTSLIYSEDISGMMGIYTLDFAEDLKPIKKIFYPGDESENMELEVLSGLHLY